MDIRFRIDQAESFRRGVDAPEPIVSLAVNPALLPEDQRDLIGKHLLGTDVVYDPKRALQSDEVVPIGGHPGAELVQAKLPTLDSLLVALAELDPQTNSNIHAVPFCGDQAVAQKSASI